MMADETIDCGAMPVVDNHCHPVLHDQRMADVAAWRSHFSEGGPESRDRHVAQSVAYREALSAIARFLGCPPDEAEVLRARPAAGVEELCAGYWADAGLAGLVVDDGFPPEGLGIPADQLGAGRCPVRRVLRLETLFERLITAHVSLEAVREALRAELEAEHARGTAGLKSIAAYRGGLTVRRRPAEDVGDAFDAARAQVARGERLRLADPQLRDDLLHVAFGVASRLEWPVQFHCGYGDTDSDLRHANPLRLRAVLEDPAYRSMPVVLLHEAYPYTREGAYLCAVYDQVHMDLSYAVPPIGAQEMAALTRAALAVAPWTKLLYASDGVGIPELHWWGAHRGRRILGGCLHELVRDGSLDRGMAEGAAAAVLGENARRLYRFPPSRPAG